MRRLRVALAQIDSTVGDFAGNRALILDAARRAAERDADLVAFPELAICGYPPEDLLLRASFIDEAVSALAALARDAEGLPPLIVGGLAFEAVLYNSAAVVHGGRIVGGHRKQRLPNYGVFDEQRYFQPGRVTPRFIVGGVEVAATVCEDIWYPDGPARDAALAGAEVIVNINASPFHAGKASERERMLATRAVDNHVAIAYVNQVGGQDELVFDGNSLVLDARGELLARGASMREDLVVVDIPVDDVRQVRLHESRVVARVRVARVRVARVRVARVRVARVRVARVRVARVRVARVRVARVRVASPRRPCTSRRPARARARRCRRATSRRPTRSPRPTTRSSSARATTCARAASRT